MNRKWVYIIAGAGLVAGGFALLAQVDSPRSGSGDPIAEAERLLSSAQTKVSEIEAGLGSARAEQPEVTEEA